MKLRVRNTDSNLEFTKRMNYDHSISKSGKIIEIYVSDNAYPHLRGDAIKIKQALGF